MFLFVNCSLSVDAPFGAFKLLCKDLPMALACAVKTNFS